MRKTAVWILVLCLCLAAFGAPALAEAPAEEASAEELLKTASDAYKEQDYEKAMEWFRRAAEQGNAAAHYNLACCYYNGQGVQKDHGKAVEWLQKAARQGDKDAQEALRKRGHSW